MQVVKGFPICYTVEKRKKGGIFMKEQLHTIPVNEAFESGDECPFCYLERQSEQRAIRYVAGSSYMEPDVRAATDKAGFCGQHLKKLYDYGNSLGNALIMQTYYVGLLKELREQTAGFQLPKKSLFSQPEEPPIVQWAKRRTSSCFLCKTQKDNMDRYIRTFFALLKEPEFRDKAAGSKGFCMRHFSQLLESAQKQLPKNQQEWFYSTVFSLMEKNLARVQGDIDWFTAKFDYRNANADWKNSKDAVSRGMQKLQGIYPADPPYKKD